MQQVIGFTAREQGRGSIVQQQFNTQVFRTAALLPFIPLEHPDPEPRQLARLLEPGGMKFPKKRVRVHTIRRPVFERDDHRPLALELPGSNPEGISSARGPIEQNTDSATTMTRVRFIQGVVTLLNGRAAQSGGIELKLKLWKLKLKRQRFATGPLRGCETAQYFSGDRITLDVEGVVDGAALSS